MARRVESSRIWLKVVNAIKLMPGLPWLDPPRAAAQPQPEPGNGKVNDAHTHTHELEILA